MTAGCGSDSPPTTGPLSAAEWREKVNALCAEIGPKIRRVPRPRAESEIASFVAAVIPLWKREEDGVRALVPPAELATTARELVEALGYVNIALLEIHISTQRNDGLRRFDAVRRSEAAARDVKLKAQVLRLPACARQRIP